MPIDPFSTGSVSQRDVDAAAAYIQAHAAAKMLIERKTIAADGDNFDFTEIPQNFLDLLLVVIARGVAAAGDDGVGLRFNGDSGSNYSGESALGTSNAAVAGSEDPQNVRGQAGNFPGGNVTPAALFGATQIWIPGYTSTVWQKMWVTNGAYMRSLVTNGGRTNSYNGVWADSSPITRIQAFALNGGGCVGGSEARLYGLG